MASITEPQEQKCWMLTYSKTPHSLNETRQLLAYFFVVVVFLLLVQVQAGPRGEGETAMEKELLFVTIHNENLCVSFLIPSSASGA